MQTCRDLRKRKEYHIIKLKKEQEENKRSDREDGNEVKEREHRKEK